MSEHHGVLTIGGKANCTTCGARVCSHVGLMLSALVTMPDQQHADLIRELKAALPDDGTMPDWALTLHACIDRYEQQQQHAGPV